MFAPGVVDVYVDFATLRGATGAVVPTPTRPELSSTTPDGPMSVEFTYLTKLFAVPLCVTRGFIVTLAVPSGDDVEGVAELAESLPVVSFSTNDDSGLPPRVSASAAF